MRGQLVYRALEIGQECVKILQLLSEVRLDSYFLIELRDYEQVIGDGEDDDEKRGGVSHHLEHLLGQAEVQVEVQVDLTVADGLQQVLHLVWQLCYLQVRLHHRLQKSLQ